MHPVDNSLLDYLTKAEAFLRKKNVERPRLDAQLIFSHILGIERVRLFMEYDRPLSTEEIDAMRNLTVERAAGKPIAHILGFKEFYSRKFMVNSHVLIPRPETEELVDIAKDILSRSGQDKKNLLDMGTGSGVIGITLLLEKPESIQKIIFADISPQALDVCRENFHKLCPEVPENTVVFLQTDLFESLDDSLHGQLDLILSNPPYVLPDEYETLETDVKDYEPRIALTHPDMENFYRSFFSSARLFLSPGSPLLLESSPTLIPLLLPLAEENRFREPKVYKDLSGKERFISWQKIV